MSHFLDRLTFFKRVSEAKQDHPFQRDLPRRGSLW